MEMKKIKESYSPLVGRTEAIFKISFTGDRTPSHEEVQKAVAEQMKADIALVDVDNIKQDFGSATATAEVFVYKDAKAMQTFWVKPKAPKEKKEASK